jgi:hypothetical protein
MRLPSFVSIAASVSLCACGAQGGALSPISSSVARPADLSMMGVSTQAGSTQVIFASDQDAKRIDEFDPVSGRLIGHIQLSGIAISLAMDKEGNLYDLEQNSQVFSLKEFAPPYTGTPTSLPLPAHRLPRELKVDVNGNRWIPAIGSPTVRGAVFEYPSGSTTPIVFTHGPWYPDSTAVDSSGNLWVSGVAKNASTPVTGYYPATGGAFVPVKMRSGSLSADDRGNLFVLRTPGEKKGTLYVYAAGSTTPSATIPIVSKDGTWLPEMAINGSEDRIFMAATSGIGPASGAIYVLAYPSGTRLATLGVAGGKHFYNAVTARHVLFEL